MGKTHLPIVFTLIIALILSGCQSGRPMTVAEYRPAQAVIARGAPKSEVFELVRWQQATPASIHQIPVEVQRRYLDRGQPLGFARVDGKLFAVAGDSQLPLVEAHYEWKGVPVAGHFEGIDVPRSAIFLVLVGAVVAGIVVLIRDNRHWFSNWFGGC
jgi:hypothetical protein